MSTCRLAGALVRSGRSCPRLHPPPYPAITEEARVLDQSWVFPFHRQAALDIGASFTPSAGRTCRNAAVVLPSALAPGLTFPLNAIAVRAAAGSLRRTASLKDTLALRLLLWKSTHCLHAAACLRQVQVPSHNSEGALSDGLQSGPPLNCLSIRPAF